jgi:hypothetical protein
VSACAFWRCSCAGRTVVELEGATDDLDEAFGQYDGGGATKSDPEAVKKTFATLSTGPHSAFSDIRLIRGLAIFATVPEILECSQHRIEGVVELLVSGIEARYIGIELCLPSVLISESFHDDCTLKGQVGS